MAGLGSITRSRDIRRSPPRQQQVATRNLDLKDNILEVREFGSSSLGCSVSSTALEDGWMSKT